MSNWGSIRPKMIKNTRSRSKPNAHMEQVRTLREQIRRFKPESVSHKRHRGCARRQRGIDKGYGKNQRDEFTRVAVPGGSLVLVPVPTIFLQSFNTALPALL